MLNLLRENFLNHCNSNRFEGLVSAITLHVEDTFHTKKTSKDQFLTNLKIES